MNRVNREFNQKKKGKPYKDDKNEVNFKRLHYFSVETSAFRSGDVWGGGGVWRDIALSPLHRAMISPWQIPRHDTKVMCYYSDGSDPRATFSDEAAPRSWKSGANAWSWCIGSARITWRAFMKEWSLQQKCLEKPTNGTPCHPKAFWIQALVEQSLWHAFRIWMLLVEMIFLGKDSSEYRIRAHIGNFSTRRKKLIQVEVTNGTRNRKTSLGIRKIYQ